MIEDVTFPQFSSNLCAFPKRSFVQRILPGFHSLFRIEKMFCELKSFRRNRNFPEKKHFRKKVLLVAPVRETFFRVAGVFLGVIFTLRRSKKFAHNIHGMCRKLEQGADLCWSQVVIFLHIASPKM